MKGNAMTRNLKTLHLLVGALLVLLGLMAQAANAHTPARFTTEQELTTIRGVHDPGTAETTISITGSTVHCEIEEFHVETVGKSFESIGLVPTYTQCQAFGLMNGKITGFGHYGEAVEGAGPYCFYSLKASGKIDLVCPAGKEVTIEVGTVCIAHLPSQANLGTIQYTTGLKDGKHDLTIDVNLTAITVTHTDGLGCPFAGSGEVSNATMTGKWTFWGQDPTSGAAVGITWDATVA